MRWRVLFWSVWLLLAFAFSVRFIFADGEPCYDCQNCWENIRECAANGGCSSNCVKFSPSDCSNFVNGVLAELETITNTVDEIDEYLDGYNYTLVNFVYPFFSSASHSIRDAISTLDDYSSTNSAALSSAIDPIQYALSKVSVFSNYWSKVDGSSGSLFVSNQASHAFLSRVPGTYKVSYLAKLIVPRLSSAISILSDLHDYHINEIASVREDLESALAFIEQGQSYVQQASAYVSLCKDDLLPTIRTSSANIDRSLSTVNCEPCGRGRDGSGGSGGGTVDFTGVSAALDEIKTLLQRVYDLIYNFYTDYNDSRNSHPSGEPTYQGYVSLGDNWFKRIEYLLYSSSSIVSNNLEGTSDPDAIDGQTAFENETSGLQESIDGLVGSFDSSITSPWQKFSRSFSEFWDRLNVFNLPDQSSGQLGQLEWSHLEILKYDKDESSFTLQAESDLDSFPSVWYKFAVGFRLLWFLLVLTLYCIFFVFMIKYSFKVAVFVTKLLNTSFGSG